MGVKTLISLEEVNALFPSFIFLMLTPTSSGVMDTTYIVANNTEEFILKKYEREIKKQVDINSFGLNTPQLLASKNGWYIYTKLKGKMPKTISYFHIQALARFLAVFHTRSSRSESFSIFLDNYALESILQLTKKKFYSFYKKLEILKTYKQTQDGFIHGDIFKDNTIFDKEKVGVFDFVDGGCGSFTFDVAVTLVAFNSLKRSSYTKLFLQTYNQNAPKKIKLNELQQEIKLAAKFYSLLRIDKEKNTRRAKELMVHF